MLKQELKQIEEPTITSANIAINPLIHQIILTENFVILSVLRVG
jgi:hypothetical protein